MAAVASRASVGSSAAWRWRRSSPPGPPPRAASGWHWPAAWRWRAWRSAAARGRASGRASPRCSRPWPSSARSFRRAAHAGHHGADPRAAPRSRDGHARCSSWSACLLRLDPQRGHHRLLHLGDRRRPRRVRRHLRRARAAPRLRGRDRRRARAHGGRPPRLGRSSPASVQVLVYRRGLLAWDDLAEGARPRPPRRVAGGEPAGPAQPGRFDPRAVSLAAAVAFVLLLSSTSWPVLLAVALFLAIAWSVSRPDTSVLPTGLAFCAVLGGGALLFGSAAAWASTPRCVGRCGPRCSCSWPPGCGPPRGPKGCARWGGVCSGGSAHAGDAGGGRVLDSLGSEGRLAQAARSLGDSIRATCHASRCRSWTRCSPGW